MSRAVLATLAILAFAAPGTSAFAATPTKDELERQKLEQEIRKLRTDNDRAESKREYFLAFAPFVTVIGAILAIGLPVWKETRERRHQRAEELEQQKLELRRRFEEQFGRAIADLGDDKEAVQVSGAVLLENFLRPDYADFHDQVYRVLCANLTVDHSRLVNRFLARAFAQAARVHVAAAAKSGERATLDFARCHANRVDLSGLDLTGADFAFGHFRSANLTGCDLTRALGRETHFEKARFSRSTLTEVRFHKAYCEEAQFHEAVMTSAELRGADLRNAAFQQARLQGAHLNEAKLTGARFDQANLSDAYFTGAELDEGVLRSVLNAADESWRKAHFDPAVEHRLAELAQRRVGA